MPLIRDALGGSSSYGSKWPHPGAVTEVSAQEAADLLRIDPQRYTEVIPEPDPPAAAAEDAEAREVTEPAPAAEFSESPAPRGKSRRGKPVTEDASASAESNR